MPEVSSIEAGKIIGRHADSIRRYVRSGQLPARLEGPRGYIWVEIDDLRQFAAEYRFRFDEALARQLTSQ